MSAKKAVKRAIEVVCDFILKVADGVISFDKLCPEILRVK
jgi:hypothetical protein